MQRAAQALATERDQIRHLGALVAVGQESSVIRRDTDLLERAIAIDWSQKFQHEAELGNTRWKATGGKRAFDLVICGRGNTTKHLPTRPE